jgi:hypothetical protein
VAAAEGAGTPAATDPPTASPIDGEGTASTRGDVGWEFGPGELIGRIVYGELSMSQTLINMLLNRSLLKFSQTVVKW